MEKRIYQLETLTCPSCMAKIEGALKRTPGVIDSEVLFNSSRARVQFDSSKITTDEIKAVIEKLGFKVLSEK